MRQDITFHRICGSDRHPPNSVVFQVVPDQFVWIQFQRIGRKKKPAQLVGHRLDELPDHDGFVLRIPVHDQEDNADFGIEGSDEVLEKLGMMDSNNFYQKFRPSFFSSPVFIVEETFEKLEFRSYAGDSPPCGNDAPVQSG
jgi:hypothetical protein